MDQIQYASSLEQMAISRERLNNKSSELSEFEKAEFSSLIGQLNWIATQPRPDIAFEACELSGAYSKDKVGDILKLNKVISRVVTDCVKLRFHQMIDLSGFLKCYCDASFANLPGGGSQEGLIILLRDENGSKCPLYWQIRKVRRVMKLTLAAETLAHLSFLKRHCSSPIPFQ